MSFTGAAGGTNRPVAGIVPRATVFIACVLVLPLAGCGLFGSKSPSYGGEAKREGPLEVPPDLAPIPKDERYALPDQGTSANALRSAAGGASGSQAVALGGVHARVVRDGAQRWLVVDVPPEKAYQVVKDFWPSVGFAVKTDEPAVGVIETDWVEKRPSVPTGLIQQALNLVLESVTSTGLKDEFRTRIERTPTDTSEIYITHYGLEEVYSNPAKTTTTWQPRAREPELEAEMLQRLLMRFETGESGGNVAKGGSGKGTPATTAAAAVTALPSVSRIVKDGTESHLEVDEPFDRAWRRVGLALDRGGFTVEDRDRAKGLYFVRYLDPDYEAKKRDSRGFFTKIFEQDPKVDPQQFRVALLTEGERTSVRVQDKDGHPEAGSAGDRILKQLDEQMR